jgi:hypothetical protein
MAVFKGGGGGGESEGGEGFEGLLKMIFCQIQRVVTMVAAVGRAQAESRAKSQR